MEIKLAIIGFVFLGAAVIGGGLKAFGVEVPLVASPGRQLLLGIVGVAALIAAVSAPQQNKATPPHGGTTGPPSSNGSREPAPARTPGTVLFRKKGARLNYGYALSFSDPTLRPVETGGMSGGSGDLYIAGMLNYVQSSAKLALYDGKAGFADCRDDVDWVPIANPNTDGGLVGKTLCVTTAHRIAACYVTTDTTSDFTNTPDHGLIMNVTVYAWH